MYRKKQIHIRPYLDSDYGEVIALWRLVFPDTPAWNDPGEDIRRKLKVQPELFIVALSSSQLIGTAMAGFDGHRGWVYYVTVNPHYQRQGIATELMKQVELKLKEIGCTKLNLQVRATNKEVISFYKKLGYTIEDRVSMSKHLI